ncbi:MAG: TonB-dependent receptor [Gemmatimonadota bacterium]|nr:TonB-dependent receptor [Gemmatimonadota bacterium]
MSSRPVRQRRAGASGLACALFAVASTLVALALAVPTAAQTPPIAADPIPADEDVALTIQGRIVDESGRAIPYADVAPAGSPRSVRADADGRFRLAGLEAGVVTITVSAHGYGAVEVEIEAGAEAPPLAITLALDPVALDAITVTGTMKAASVSASPVKVNVVPQSVLQRNATNNLVEAISYVNGLYQQVDCGVCYTNNLRINGMEGPYTAVLIDGMPIMSSLASVYGLNGINPALIQQVEIIKGPSSTLYGSEAMAGVINVITKDPRFTPRLALDASGTSDAEGNVDFAFSTEPGDVSGFVSGNVAYNSRFVDDNGDGFTDFPLNRRGVVFAKMDWSPEGRRRTSLTTRYLHEDRFGGVEAWTAADRGSSNVYGESIRTNRLEVLGAYLPSWSADIRFEGSYAWHDQDSWYGDSSYDASQHIAFANALWGRMVGRQDLLIGATARYQTYDDNTPATVRADRRFIPGILAQNEVRLADGALTALGGLRADHHDKHGVIASPRIALKWDATGHTAMRLNAGTGFRVVNLFTEDHAALTGARGVVIASELAPERSRSVTLNLNRIVEFGPSPMMIDLDLFHTRFSNRIRPDYDIDPNLIVYDNLSGHAVSRGVSVAFNQNVDFDRLLYSAGVTWQDVYLMDAKGAREEDFFAPKLRGVFSVTYSMRSLPVTLDYTGSVTGPMRLPSYEEPFARPERSPAYSIHNMQATWRLEDGAALYLSVKNLFNFTQPSPLIDPANPFGDAFDTAYVYGPMRGRHVMLGFRYGASR